MNFQQFHSALRYSLMRFGTLAIFLGSFFSPEVKAGWVKRPQDPCSGALTSFRRGVFTDGTFSFVGNEVRIKIPRFWIFPQIPRSSLNFSVHLNSRPVQVHETSFAHGVPSLTIDREVLIETESGLAVIGGLETNSPRVILEESFENLQARLQPTSPIVFARIIYSAFESSPIKHHTGMPAVDYAVAGLTGSFSMDQPVTTLFLASGDGTCAAFYPKEGNGLQIRRLGAIDRDWLEPGNLNLKVFQVATSPGERLFSLVHKNQLRAFKFNGDRSASMGALKYDADVRIEHVSAVTEDIASPSAQAHGGHYDVPTGRFAITTTVGETVYEIVDGQVVRSGN